MNIGGFDTATTIPQYEHKMTVTSISVMSRGPLIIRKIKLRSTVALKLINDLVVVRSTVIVLHHPSWV